VVDFVAHVLIIFSSTSQLCGLYYLYHIADDFFNFELSLHVVPINGHKNHICATSVYLLSALPKVQHSLP